MPKLFIKNMVCNRCIMVVEDELKKLSIRVTEVKLGEVEIESPLSSAQSTALNDNLKALGFEILDDKKNRIIEQIKNHIIQLVHYQNNQSKLNLSDFLSHELNLDYNYLSALFSEIEGTTIEKYFILQKIEKVKELLAYNELSLSEIADQLNYSSVAYLSNQFKKITGLSPSDFKKTSSNKRNALDKL